MTSPTDHTDPFVIVLGVAQDGGHPQPGCPRPCCEAAWLDPSKGHQIASLGLVDPVSNERWLLDASPDFPAQWAALNDVSHQAKNAPLTGILLTHAHIGHYAGLMYLGRESVNATGIPVYAMQRMERFLKKHGPWEQLVTLNNIEVLPFKNGQRIRLNERLSATPVMVPHRGEYSETVGLYVEGPKRSFFYLPDVDKWERMKAVSIESLIQRTDLAFLDGTFFTDEELPGRSMSEIPHPFIAESLKRFAVLPAHERDKVRFIHFNHTNPVLQADHPRIKEVEAAGMHVSLEGQVFRI